MLLPTTVPIASSFSAQWESLFKEKVNKIQDFRTQGTEKMIKKTIVNPMRRVCRTFPLTILISGRVVDWDL